MGRRKKEMAIWAWNKDGTLYRTFGSLYEVAEETGKSAKYVTMVICTGVYINRKWRLTKVNESPGVFISGQGKPVLVEITEIHRFRTGKDAAKWLGVHPNCLHSPSERYKVRFENPEYNL